MLKHKSPSATSPHRAEDIFAVLSDLSRLEKVQLPPEVDGLKLTPQDADSCLVELSMGLETTLRIVQRTPYSEIHFAIEHDMLAEPISIQLTLVCLEDNVTEINSYVEANLPMMIQMMAGAKLKQALDKLPDLLSRLPYGQMI